MVKFYFLNIKYPQVVYSYFVVINLIFVYLFFKFQIVVQFHSLTVHLIVFLCVLNGSSLLFYYNKLY